MTIHPDTIRDAVARRAIAKAELARRAEIHQSSLTGLEREDWNPTWSTLTKLCTAVEEITRERA